MTINAEEEEIERAIFFLYDEDPAKYWVKVKKSRQKLEATEYVSVTIRKAGRIMKIIFGEEKEEGR